MGETNDWIEDCLRERGHVLTNWDAHYCPDWDFMPVDSHTPEYDCCTCDKTLMGRMSNWLFMIYFNYLGRKAQKRASRI